MLAGIVLLLILVLVAVVIPFWVGFRRAKRKAQLVNSLTEAPRVLGVQDLPELLIGEKPGIWLKKEKISLIVPFKDNCDGGIRSRTWAWLREYWQNELPEAEIILSPDYSTPFCKTAAVNRGMAMATGDVMVLLDADCYTTAEVIRGCAENIREARRNGDHLWYVPYRRFYRLSEQASNRLLLSDPARSLQFSDPLCQLDEDPARGSAGVPFGHWYGALIQIWPREAFETTHGMDERFNGWGGEDLSYMLALDTLYAKHKTIDAPVYHVWHPSIQGKWKLTRQWDGQAEPEMNDWLTTQYEAAFGDPDLMRRLVSGEDVRLECLKAIRTPDQGKTPVPGDQVLSA